MKRFAVDVVMLPPDPVMDVAIEWNQMLLKTGPQTILLDKRQRLPHISMAMGCLQADKLEKAKAILRSIATVYHTIELRVPQIRTSPTASATVVSFDIELSRKVAALHESIVRSLWPLLTQDAKDEDINDLPPIETSSLQWINNYIPNHCYDRFWPHITLGFGEPTRQLQPFTFEASRLAICHLGNHCTCTRILCETVLSPL